MWPSGFDTLDTYLSGGLRSGELTLLGGPQGLGKTTFALQMLRHAAASGEAVIYFSYEHDASTVLERLIAIEAASLAGIEAVSLRRIRESLEASDGREGSLADRLRNTVGGSDAVAAVQAYADRLYIHRSSGTETSVYTVRQVVDQARTLTGQPPMVVVDYLQKVFVPGGSELEEERVTKIVEGLKDLALDHDVPRVGENRLHGGVRRLQPDARPLGVIPLERGLAADERHHRLAVLRAGAPRHHDVVAIADSVVDHGIPAHAEDEVLSLPEERRWDLDRLVVGKRLDGAAGGDGAEQRHLARVAGQRVRGGRRRDAAAAIPLARESALLLQPLQVLLNRSEGGQLELLANLTLGRRNPLFIPVAPDEIEDFLLAFGEVHRLPKFVRFLTLYY